MFYDVEGTVNASGVLVNKPLIPVNLFKNTKHYMFRSVDHLQVLSEYKMYHYIVT
jgi:hypothetical protein